MATVPAFLAMTPNDSPGQRLRTARLACTVAAGILLVFGLTGQLVFRVMGITMPAFQMACQSGPPAGIAGYAARPAFTRQRDQ